MFSTPSAGWTCLSIGSHKVGSISYLTDVPFEFITTCCDYLKNPVGFNIVFEGECLDKGISLIGNYFCSYSLGGNEPPYLTDLTPVSDFILCESNDGPEFIEKLLEEAISDFEQDFDLWAMWNPGLYEDEEELQTNRKALSELIAKGKETIARKPYIMPELGHILWGNPSETYPVDRHSFEDAFFSVFGDIFDEYGYLDDDLFRDQESELGGFENDIFSISPDYWGDDEDLDFILNFVYKPEDLRITWYKYIARDARSSAPFPKEHMREVFEKCRNSMN